MKQLAIQFIVGRRPQGVDDVDLDWREIVGERFGLHEHERAWQAAEAYDADFDHRFTHRVVEVEVEATPPAPRPIVKTTPPPAPAPAAAPLPKLEGTPKPARKVKSQLAQFRAQQAFAKTAKLLREGVAAGFDGAWYEMSLDALAGYLGESGSSQLTVAMAKELYDLRTLVAAGTKGRPALKVVK
jgi:hypothetical protein